MHTVFILGAGASKQAGAPLMADFLDCASDLLRLKTSGIEEARSEFEDVFDAITELNGIHTKSYLNFDNIEDVFGAIEMALLLKKLGNRKLEEIQRLRESLITLIFKTLEYSIRFPVRKRQICPPEPYNLFMHILKLIKGKQPPQDPHEFAFITFNYDLCLDYALYFHSFRFNYCLNGKTQDSAIPLLKLHGSINWGLSNQEEIIPKNVSEFDLYDQVEYVHLNLGSTLNLKKHDGKPLQGPPVIVPPTWNKNSYHGQLFNVWAVAAEELANAENIFIIGYSLPEADSFFRYLYALGSESRKKLRNFIVINIDDSGKTMQRFKQLIGKGIENRFRYISTDFKSGISSIDKILENP